MSEEVVVLPELVVCAAIRNTVTGEVVAGVRHFDPVMRERMKADGEGKRIEWNRSEQGFLTNRFRFVNRKEAWEIAEREGQIRRQVSSYGTLYSENLY
jgi:hypothetical protein